ncbi:cyclic nucleotide-binding domain-containing protein [Hydrogenophaga defluvii]|uniref:Cyclic nucleotide-binding domain-containing protein n=1 Tax=Hydrogenophaga defluvii TaxID=249410 RepID=A0ABW2SFG6_9BURK
MMALSKTLLLVVPNATLVLGLVIWHQFGIQGFFYFLGHLSFAISFVGYSQRSMIRLRLFAVLGLFVGLVYNGYVHMNMPPNQNLWPVLFWMTVFLIQNLVFAVLEIRGSLEVSLPPDQRAILVESFPHMHSRDWAQLVAKVDERGFSQGEAVLSSGEATTSLMLLVSGRCSEVRHDLPSSVRSLGTFWGELTYCMGSALFNRSPCDVLVVSEKAVVYVWSYETLRELEAGNPRLAKALRDAFIWSACTKHALLRPRAEPQLDTSPGKLIGLVAEGAA